MDQKEIEFLIKEGEGLTVEFREKYTSRIDQDLVAFANTKGGKVILGINDENKVVGTRLTNEVKSQVISLARNCHPSIPISLKQVGPVTVIEVPEGDEKPYSCSEGYYRRLDATSQKMSPAEIKTFFRESVDVFYEGLPRKDVALSDISLTKIKAFLQASKTPLSITKSNLAAFLTSLGVYENGHIANAGVLMFANNVGRFIHHSESILLALKGTEKRHIYDRLDVRDDLLTQFNQAVLFIKKHINVRTVIKGFEREDIYELPLDALREALVNALVHRDYSMRGTSVYVEIYDDRVEIVNPGGLPKGLDKKNFEGTSIRRNEILADLFARMEEMERSGLGIKQMKDLMAEAGLRPPIFEVDNFFRAVFYRDPQFSLKRTDGGGPEKVTVKVTERVTVKVTENQRKIMVLIEKDPHVTAEKLAKRVGISVRKIKQNIKRLKESGTIERVGSDKAGRWELKGKQ